MFVFFCSEFKLKNLLSRSAGPQTIPSQTYDYAALNTLTLRPQDLGGNASSQVRNEHDGNSSVQDTPSVEVISPAEGAEGLSDIDDDSNASNENDAGNNDIDP